MVNSEPRFLNESGWEATYTDDGGYLVVCPLILVVLFTREGGGGRIECRTGGFRTKTPGE